MQQRKKVKDKDPELTFQAHTVQAQPVPVLSKFPLRVLSFSPFPSHICSGKRVWLPLRTVGRGQQSSPSNRELY